MNYDLKEFKLSESLLNDEKKKQIIDSLDKEITEMRAKYFLKQPGEVKPTSVSFSNNVKQINESPISNRPQSDTNIGIDQEFKHKQANLNNNNGNRNNYSFNNQLNSLEGVNKESGSLNNYINTYSYNSSNSPMIMDNNPNMKINSSNHQDTNTMIPSKNRLNNTYSQSNNTFNNYSNPDLFNLTRFNPNVNNNLNKVNVVNYDQLNIKQDIQDECHSNNKSENRNKNINIENEDEELHHSHSVYDMINNKRNQNIHNVNEIDFNDDYKKFQMSSQSLKDNDSMNDNRKINKQNKEKEVNPNIVSFNPQYFKTQSKKESVTTQQHNYNSSVEKTLSNNNSKSKVANSVSQGASTNIRVNKDSSEYGEFMRQFNKNEYLQNEDNEILIEQ